MEENVYKDEIIFNVKSSSPTTNPTVKKSYMSSKSEFNFTRKRRTFSPEKRKELEEIYQRVVVNDYGDEYHMSEEDRKKKSQYYEAFTKVNKCKRKFRKIDEYVKVYRLVIDCIKLVAEDNGIYDPIEFTKKVLRGKIKLFGLHFPKYIGKDKKEINWEYVSQYISDTSKDPSELIKRDRVELSDEELLQFRMFQEQMRGIRPIEGEPVMPKLTNKELRKSSYVRRTLSSDEYVVKVAILHPFAYLYF
jgi:hypothetical protein